MISIYKRGEEDTYLKEESNFGPGSWVYAEDPTDEELSDLARRLNLEESLLKDGTDPYEVPRMETDNGSVYVFTRAPFDEGNRITTAPFLLVVGKDFVLTISRHRLSSVKKLTARDSGIMTADRVLMLTTILSAIYRTYDTFLTNIRKSVRGVSYDMEKITNQEIVQFVSFENVINDFLSALVPTNAIIANFLSGKILPVSEDEKEKIEDLYLETGQLIELSKSSLKAIVNIREATSTIMTNNLNRVMKMLTALTIVLTVPTIISSFYGMNVARLPVADGPYAFWIILGGTVVISSFIIWVLNRNKWF
jgi:magnesium transporter